MWDSAIVYLKENMKSAFTLTNSPRFNQLQGNTVQKGENVNNVTQWEYSINISGAEVKT